MTSIGESIRPGAHLLTITEVAQYFRKGTETIGRWRRIGIWVGSGADRKRIRLHCLKSGGTWLVPTASVDQFLAETSGVRAGEPVAKEFHPAETVGHRDAMSYLKARGFVPEVGSPEPLALTTEGSDG